MTLHEYVDLCRDGGTRTLVYRALARASGVHWQTIKDVDRGMRLSNYDKAKALSNATGGKVSIKELCDGK